MYSYKFDKPAGEFNVQNILDNAPNTVNVVVIDGGGGKLVAARVSFLEKFSLAHRAILADEHLCKDWGYLIVSRRMEAGKLEFEMMLEWKDMGGKNTHLSRWRARVWNGDVKTVFEEYQALSCNIVITHL